MVLLGFAKTRWGNVSIDGAINVPVKYQLALLLENEQFRAINQIVIQSLEAIHAKNIARGIDTDAPLEK